MIFPDDCDFWSGVENLVEQVYLQAGSFVSYVDFAYLMCSYHEVITEF